MPQNPLQFCPIEPQPRDHRELKVLELGVGARRVLYGPSIRPRIEIRDEHVEIELREHAVLAALRLTAGLGERPRFLTVGDDHRILIWNLQGEVEAALEGHTARIGGVWELTGNRLVSWGEDGWLHVWSTRPGNLQSRIHAPLRAADRVFIAPAGDFFCLSHLWKARLVGIDGDELAVLKWQFEPVTDARRLESGRWLTKSKLGMKLWSWRGRLQRTFPRAFSFDGGYFDLPNGQLLVVDELACIELIGRDGARLGTRAADEDLAKDLRKFHATRKRMRETNQTRQTYAQFEHRRSPIAEPAMPPKDAQQKLVLVGEKQARARPVWDFFHRPDLKTIRTSRRFELQVALDLREHVLAAIHTDRSDGSTATRFALLFCGLFGAAAMTLLQSRETGWIVASLLFVLGTSYAAIFLHRRALALTAAERALLPLIPEIDRLAAEIRAHRRSILASLPVVRSPELYAGSEARQQIERTIAEELKDAALATCRLRRSDLVTLDRSPIVLSDWALLRHGERAASAVPSPDLHSFWWTPDGSFVCAVQSLLYVLATNEKIDVFSVDYDFVARRAYNQTAHSFYYRDVTHITARDVSRPVPLPGISASVGATEIALVLRNGKRVVHTVIDGDSALALRRAVRTAISARDDEQAKILQAELANWQRDLDHSDEERSNEIRSLRAQLAALECESLAADIPDPTRRRPDDIVAYLRSLILPPDMSGTG